jgi:HAD superfamily phosphatase (TIGR01681 family)
LSNPDRSIENLGPLRIAILGSHNLTLLSPVLQRALEARGFHDVLVHIGPFGRFREELLAAKSAMDGFAPTHVLILSDFADVFADLLREPLLATADRTSDRISEEIANLRSGLIQLQQRLPHVTTLVATLVAPPHSALGPLEHNSEYSLRHVSWRFNLELRELMRALPSVLVLDYDGLVTWIGYRVAYDERLWFAGRMRLGPAGLTALADECSRLLLASSRTPKKCIVLDLDGTLWGGTVGEGVDTVVIGHDGVGLAYRGVQQELLNLRQRGILLAIASKNNADDVAPLLDGHPQMLLRRHHFAASRINWASKAKNIREIAEELGIGLDSIVFLDDDPAERDWVASQLPEVEVASLGDDPAYFARELLSIDSLAVSSMTTEDRGRPALYEARARAEMLRRTVPTLSEFLAALRMEVRVALAGEWDVSRKGPINSTSRRVATPRSRSRLLFPVLGFAFTSCGWLTDTVTKGSWVRQLSDVKPQSGPLTRCC